MTLKKAALIGGSLAVAYAIGRNAGIVDCVKSVDKAVTKNHKIGISKAVWRPFKKGVQVTIEALKEES